MRLAPLRGPLLFPPLIFPPLPTSLSACALLAVALALPAGCPGGDGPTDAGDGDVDAGTAGDGDGDGDGGACADAADPDLGDLVLGAGYVKVGAAVLPAGLTRAVLLADGADVVAVGLDEVGLRVVQLGTWPDLALGATWFDLLRPGDEANGAAFVSPYLVTDGAWVAAGYTQAFDAELGTFPGALALANLYEDTAGATFLDAPGNYTASFVAPDTLAVNGFGLEGVGGGPALYALELGAEEPPITLATFPGDVGGSGYTAGNLVEGRVAAGYADTDFVNHLFLLDESTIEGAWQGSPVDLDGRSPVDAASPGVLEVTGFGEGWALLRGGYDASFSRVEDDVVAVSLAGDVTTVLTLPAASCAHVPFLSSFGDELVIGVTHADGTTSLVRVRSSAP